MDVFRDIKISSKENTKFTLKYDLLREHYRIIRTWEPQSDIWPLKYGRTILITAATITGIYINHRFRAKLKLRGFGMFPTMFGVTIVSTSATSFFHSEFIMDKLMLLDISCPLCLESKSALLQTFTGLLVPLFVTPLANFSFAVGRGVYNVPHITDGRKIFRTVASAYKPLIPNIALLFTIHVLLAGFVTYMEIRSFLRMLDLQYLKNEEKMQKVYIE